MKSTRFLYLKKIPAKFQLACFLFFSFFTIATNKSCAKAPLPQQFGIELLYSVEHRKPGRTILFRKYLFLPAKINFLFSRYIVFDPVTFNRCLKIKTRQYYKKVYTSPILNWLVKIRTNNPGADENPAPFFFPQAF